MTTGNVECKYIFLDIEKFSTGRTIEGQVKMIQALNDAVEGALVALKVDKRKCMLLPTGDGICIAFMNLPEPYDVHIRVALSILRRVSESNKLMGKENQRFNVRVGINENNDIRIVDINHKQNIAGSGINLAQRIMNSGDGGNIIVGNTVYEKLVQREKYHESFRTFKAQIKHGEELTVHQFVGRKHSYLNSDIPSTFRGTLVSARPARPVPSLELSCFLVLLTRHKNDIQALNKSASDLDPLFLTLSYTARDYATAFENTKSPIKRPIIDPAECYDKKTNNVNIEKGMKYFRALNWIVEDLQNYFFQNLYGKLEHQYLFETGSHCLKVSKTGMSVLKKHYSELLSFFGLVQS